MIPVTPEQRVGREKIAHLVPSIIENQGAPILVRALARVLVLVKRRAIEMRQRPIVPWKMRRHPIHDDADARLVQGVDQELEIIRCAEPRRR